MAEQHFLEPFYRIETTEDIYYLHVETRKDLKEALGMAFPNTTYEIEKADLNKEMCARELAAGNYLAFFMFEQSHLTNLTPDPIRKEQLAKSFYEKSKLKKLQQRILRKRFPERITVKKAPRPVETAAPK